MSTTLHFQDLKKQQNLICLVNICMSVPNEYTFKLCSIFQHFPWWLHGSEHPVYSLCSLQTYIMYLIKYLAITIYFSVMSNKLLPYHTIPNCYI